MGEGRISVQNEKWKALVNFVNQMSLLEKLRPDSFWFCRIVKEALGKDEGYLALSLCIWEYMYCMHFLPALS